MANDLPPSLIKIRRCETETSVSHDAYPCEQHLGSTLHNSLEYVPLENRACDQRGCAHIPFVSFSHSIMPFVFDTVALEDKQKFYSMDPGVLATCRKGLGFDWLVVKFYMGWFSSRVHCSPLFDNSFIGVKFPRVSVTGCCTKY